MCIFLSLVFWLPFIAIVYWQSHCGYSLWQVTLHHSTVFLYIHKLYLFMHIWDKCPSGASLSVWEAVQYASNFYYLTFCFEFLRGLFSVWQGFGTIYNWGGRTLHPWLQRKWEKLVRVGPLPGCVGKSGFGLNWPYCLRCCLQSPSSHTKPSHSCFREDQFITIVIINQVSLPPVCREGGIRPSMTLESKWGLFGMNESISSTCGFHSDEW